MWSPVVHSTLNESRAVPRSRSKHATCIVPDRRSVFVLGGRCASVPLRDFWILDLDSGLWTSVCDRGTPINVQEHSMTHWNDRLYVFGGVFAQAGECPLWIYRIQARSWEQWQCPKGHSAPQSRKAHSAATYGSSMFIYGGYQDMRGSLSELWQFSFETNQWKMLNGNQPKKASEVVPPSRHGHSCVVYDQGMWIYGGMTDLQPRSDLWRLDLVSKRWSAVKCKIGPGPLHSHSAVGVHSYMYIIGGERQGNLSNEVWRFHFSTETWERIETIEPKPTARTQLTAITLHGALFASKSKSNSETPVVKSIGSQQSSSSSTVARPTNSVTTSNLISLPVFSRNRGYHPVSTVTQDPSSLLVPWMIKSSTYSLLSNASTDSCLIDELDSREDRLPSMVTSCCIKQKLANRHQAVRSESAHNFASPPPARRGCSVPRSQTTARFNPFDSTASVAGVKRDETTSDYASEMADDSLACSYIGIPNPVYDDCSAARRRRDSIEEEHRSFAQALNESLTERQSRSRTTGLRNGVLAQMLRLHSSDRGALNTVCPLKEVTVQPIDPSPIAEQEQKWSVLIFGGRESGHTTTFDRPLSIWMLRL